MKTTIERMLIIEGKVLFIIGILMFLFYIIGLLMGKKAIYFDCAMFGLVTVIGAFPIYQLGKYLERNKQL